MSDKSIIIAVFGLSPREERILHTICFISQTRPRTYEILPADSLGQAVQPDIAIVDGSNPKAIVDWREFSTKYPMLPLVIIGSELGLESPSLLKIDRPLLATKLLAVFDQIQLSNEHPAFARNEGKTVNSSSQDTNQQTPRVETPTIEDAKASLAQKKLSALVVDDSLPIRLQMQKELGLFVNQVDLAETGEKALEFIASHNYDIIFLDVVLPGMDGYQICKAIKRDKRTKTIPVVMLTGKSSPFDKVRGKLAGCDTYLTKPVDLPTFKEVVQQYLIQ